LELLIETLVRHIRPDVPRIGRDVPMIRRDVPMIGADVPMIGSDVPVIASDVQTIGSDVQMKLSVHEILGGSVRAIVGLVRSAGDAVRDNVAFERHIVAIGPNSVAVVPTVGGSERHSPPLGRLRAGSVVH
jgi:hypothetical protein